MYGARFADMWRGTAPEAMKRVWSDALAEFSRDEIGRGVAACMSRDWPPTLPEFLKLCRPALDYERAFLEAVEQMTRRASGADVWSSPAVYWAAAAIGTDLHAFTYQQIAKRWQAALDKAVQRIAAGELPHEIPPRLEALPAPGESTVPPDVARKRIREALDGLRSKTVQ